MKSLTYPELVLSKLGKHYGVNLHTELSNKNMTELFVAVLLSPQSNDKQTNKVTEVLFKKFKTFNNYANADMKTLKKYLKGMNYYKTKAKHLKKSSKIIIDKFDGKVPKSLDELMELPGVGRKVGNVILNEGYGIDQGIAVDTHCGRVAIRLGLSKQKNPYKIEKDLTNTYTKDKWGLVSNTFIELGRDVCHARNRECDKCVLKDICPSSVTSSTRLKVVGFLCVHATAVSSSKHHLRYRMSGK